MIEEIINFVESDSWFEWDADAYAFITREHGDVGNEEYGRADYEEAVRIAKEINNRFGFFPDIETFDEWVEISMYGEDLDDD